MSSFLTSRLNRAARPVTSGLAASFSEIALDTDRLTRLRG